MKYFTSILLISALNLGLSQDKKASFGVQLFPNISSGISEESAEYKKYYVGIGSSVFSYSAGCELELILGEKWNLLSGILFTKTGDKSLEHPPDAKRGFLYPVTYRYELYYAELPILIERELGNKLFVQTGISPMIQLFTRLKMNGTVLSSSGFDRNIFGLNLNLGLGLKVPIGDSKLKTAIYSQYNPIAGVEGRSLLDYMPRRTNIGIGIKLSYLF